MSEPPELSELMEELFDIKPKWYPFGLQLKVPYRELNSIEKACNGDLFDAFCRMLQEWLNQQEPSWAAVVKALRSRTVNEQRLAANLQDRFVAPGGTPDGQDDHQHMEASRKKIVRKFSTVRVSPRFHTGNWSVVPQQNHVLDPNVQEDIDHLHQQFEALRFDIYDHIEETKPNRGRFAVFVSCPIAWRTKHTKPMTDIDLDRIMRPEAQFYQMFIVINQYTNWYNYELMENIAKRYGNPELKRRMEEYRSELAQFESHTSADKLKNVELARPFGDSVSVIVTLPYNQCNQFLMSDIRRVGHKYTNNAGLDPAALRTHTIDGNSVEIIFLVPVSLAPYLIASSLTISPLLTSQYPLPEDVHERCVHFMHEEEVFRLMGVSDYEMSLIFITLGHPYFKHSHMPGMVIVYSHDYCGMSLENCDATSPTQSQQCIKHTATGAAVWPSCLQVYSSPADFIMNIN